MKVIKIVVIILILFIGIYLYKIAHTSNDKLNLQVSKPIIALSTFALYDMAKNIAGGTLSCFMIDPIGVDIHDFEPTPKMMVKLYRAKLIVYSGVGLEPWVAPFIHSKNILDMGKYVKLRDINGVRDPHYWLDIDNMIIMAKLLRDRFEKISPQNKKLYQTRTKKFLILLKKIDNKYKTKLHSCKKHTIIVGHNAFSYLGHRYHFYIDSISGLAPDAQPSAKTIQRIMQDVKDNNISTIFFIPFTNTSVMKSIAHMTGAKIGILQPIVNITAKKFKEHATYFSLMMENLKKISHVLQCQ